MLGTFVFILRGSVDFLTRSFSARLLRFFRTLAGSSPFQDCGLAFAGNNSEAFSILFLGTIRSSSFLRALPRFFWCSFSYRAWVRKCDWSLPGWLLESGHREALSTAVRIWSNHHLARFLGKGFEGLRLRLAFIFNSSWF